MTGIENFNLFLLTAVLLNITPGADTVYILSRSIAQGRRAGVYAALGIGVGILVHTLMAMLGLSVVLAQSTMLFNIVKYTGAIYLFYLGLTKMFVRSGDNKGLSSLKVSGRSAFREGVITNVLNPKVALFFIAFFAQFVHPSQVQRQVPYFLLGLTFMVTGTTWNMVLACFGNGLRRYVDPQASTGAYIEQALGLVWIGLGISVLFS
ncbi:MAG: LysE family translocator [Pontibacter sp.]|nr:LysE family translocator [Pontibacter sp.]